MGRRDLTRLGDAGFFFLLLVFVVASVTAFDYYAQRLKAAVSDSHLSLMQVETRHAIDLIVQTLDAVHLSLLSLPAIEQLIDPVFRPDELLLPALTHQPHLRSISLIGPDGLILVSSNLANVGLRPDLTDFVPGGMPTTGILRIGPAYAGRDYSDGERIVERNQAPAHLEFFPVSRTVESRDRQQYVLLAVINVDFFLNRLMATLNSTQDRIDVVRYDGRLLFSTAERGLGEDEIDAIERIAARWAEADFTGTSEEVSADGDEWIATWRLARILPVGAVSWLDKNVVLADARDELRQQQWILLLALATVLLVITVSFVMVRRVYRRYLTVQTEASKRLAQLLDALPANVLLFGEDGHVRLANRSWHDFAKRHGLPLPGDAHSMHFSALSTCFSHRLAQADCVNLEQGVTAVMNEHWKAFDGEFRFEGDRGERWAQIMVRPFRQRDAKGVVMLQLDVTDRHRAEEGMEMLDAALNATANAIVITDTNAVIEWANPAFTRLTGWSASEAIGRKPKDLVKSGRQDDAFYEKLWQTILKGEVWRGELVNRHREGHLYHEALTITPVRDRQGALRHFVAVKEDITARKELELQLTREATTDPLTGVLNRRAFIDKLETEMARVRRHGRACALLMLDLDHFKRVNDTFGHAAGDEVLRCMTATASATLRRPDLIGRLGGEEFAILLPETGLQGALELAERLRHSIEQATTLADTDAIKMTTSIGVTMIAPTDTGPQQPLARADAALYRAKSAGRNRVIHGV